MGFIKVPKEKMLKILWEELEGTEIIENTIEDTDRWSTIHGLVFKMDGKFYETGYSVGATEMQDESPWEYEKEVECVEVEPVKVEVVQYLPVDQAAEVE
jgi:hypothetical protein